jgi:uncharacterized protein (DUF433 family)
MNDIESVDWSVCDAVERVPGKMGGRAVIKGTRIEPETIVNSFELGSSIEEIHGDFPTVPIDTIRDLLVFAHAQQTVL